MRDLLNALTLGYRLTVIVWQFTSCVISPSTLYKTRAAVWKLTEIVLGLIFWTPVNSPDKKNRPLFCQRKMQNTSAVVYGSKERCGGNFLFLIRGGSFVLMEISCLLNIFSVCGMNGGIVVHWCETEIGVWDVGSSYSLNFHSPDAEYLMVIDCTLPTIPTSRIRQPLTVCPVIKM